MAKKRRSMSEISEDIKANNRSKPTKEQKDELFDILAPTVIDRLPENRGDWLAVCIRLTQRAVDRSPHSTDMVAQLERLKKELEEWDKANPL